KRAYCLKTQPATGETYPKSDLFNKAMYFLSLATRTIPVGTAYAVWVGIGALGTAAYGIIYLNEDKGLLRIACFGLILAGIIGLKILAGHKQL
ncbi:DMT family transporter, partial [Klebsiella quasipneumoniae]|uniref:DMT family transporter n=1 Tax=Klebsiella quasipneumoniae TaxID=1463165 RepID=UPI003982E0E1